MPIKIVEEITHDFTDSTVVTAQQIKKLSDNLFQMLQVFENGNFRDLNSTDGRNPVKNDTRTAYFNKSDLDKLFADNKGSNGLFIYFGVHNPIIYTPREASYNNKLMAILVTGTNGVANLNVNDSVEIAGGPKTQDSSGGTGMDNGKLCPPDTTC